MTQEDFLFLARLVRRRSGLLLAEGRGPALELRLQPVMRRFGFRDAKAMMAELRLGHEALAQALTEAVTINETSFFRDPHQFARLRDHVLPGRIAARSGEKRLRIWSAGCAAGQEAWSLAMMLDAMPLSGWTVDLIATDLSGDAIARAKAGHYSQYDVLRGLSEEDVARHFTALENGFAISSRLKRTVRFRKFNLLDSFGWLDDVDLILCRNVLLHFDRVARIAVLERLAETLAPGGALLLGESETVQGRSDLFQEIAGSPGFYSPTEMPVARLAG
ncbi:MAG: protein-glutamate O-methyltransferase CheR [Alphaproteobacteria bacterium]|jgi:chemotaxis protein methyltransferase CheR|nr:protein-glutamate O-methyltransferase CheR [Alphaproteobacteria bacterium]